MGLCVSCRKSKDRFKERRNHNREFVNFIPTKNGNKLCSPIPVRVANHSADNSPTTHQAGCGAPETMASSFSNMNITNPIKGLVSKNRNRYKQDGFNLDLTYITENIIAMGYPASNIESVYRNHIDDVVKFLDKKHPGHYMIYNLCSERSYDKSKFHNMVKEFPFNDHNPPKISSIEPFCKEVDEWLGKDSQNVAVVHCKAGKGRTGTMICCYLLHNKTCSTADQALSLYGSKRTQDTKGVTIPSQVRYVQYYEQLVKKHLHYADTTLLIKEFALEPAPMLLSGQAMYFTVSESISSQKQRQKFKSEAYKIPVEDTKCFRIAVNSPVRLKGDIKIEFYNKLIMGKEKLFHFWFNTFFVGVNATSNVNGYDNNGHNGTTNEDDCFELVFGKKELDKLNKDKQKTRKIFNENFKLSMLVRKINNCDPEILPIVNNPNSKQTVPETTPSESSAGSSEESEEDDWDSVGGAMDLEEVADPRGVGYRILSESELASQLTSSSGGDNPSEILIV